MQLSGATELERRVYELCLRVESELPAGELATLISSTLSGCGNELQRLRNLVAWYERVYMPPQATKPTPSTINHRAENPTPWPAMT